MEKFIYYSELFSIYGFLLTDNQKEIFDLYYNENLSLTEISDNLKVSRSYVSKIINDVEKRLDYFEENLHHYELVKKISDK